METLEKIRYYNSLTPIRDKFWFFKNFEHESLINSNWIHKKTKIKVKILSILDDNIYIEEESGVKTIKGDHYFISYYTLLEFQSDQNNSVMDWKIEIKEKPRVKKCPDVWETASGKSETVLCIIGDKPMLGVYYNVLDKWIFPMITGNIRPEKWCYIKY